MKICPECKERYADDVEVCRKDGEELVDLPDALAGNPQLREPVAAAPDDRTSMIDLEAIAAKRKPKKEPEPEPAEPEDDKTPPPVDPVEVDGEATGTLERSRRGKKNRERTRSRAMAVDQAVAEAADDEALAQELPLDLRVNDELTNKDLAGRSRTAMSRQSQQASIYDLSELQPVADPTRPATAVAPPPRRERRMLSGTQAGFLVLVGSTALIGAIVFLARATAVLTVTTVPPGATVQLDGSDLGVTPLQKRVRTGTHVVVLTLDAYEPFKEVIDVPVGGMRFLQPLQAKPAAPPPPPSPSQIAEELAKNAARVFDAGDLDGARKNLEDALRLMPDNETAKALWPKVRAALEKRDAGQNAAEATAQRAERLRQGRVLAEEGRRLYEKGELPAAKEKLYASLKLDGSNPEPHRTLGRIFNREDQVEKVRYHLQRYLDLGGADADFKVREWLKANPR